MDMQNSLAGWIEEVADSWTTGEQAEPDSPQGQRNADDAQLAHDLADYVRDLTDSDPASAALLEQIRFLTPDDLPAEGRPAESLRKQVPMVRRQLNSPEAKFQAVETVVRGAIALKQT